MSLGSPSSNTVSFVLNERFVGIVPRVVVAYVVHLKVVDLLLARCGG